MPHPTICHTPPEYALARTHSRDEEQTVEFFRSRRQDAVFPVRCASGFWAWINLTESMPGINSALLLYLF